ncbi:MAG: pentapeptide repeat-containing protein [Crocinitomicaceae bacterium]|nr:pentapeptide repeat-containing protein [Crocinitomicaceae bacterium]
MTLKYTFLITFRLQLIEMVEQEYEAITALEKGNYENCIFRNCDFSNADFRDFNFIECEFYECDLTSAQITRTGFKEVYFKDCKLQGLQFCYASDFLFQIRFDACNLKMSSFYQMNLRKYHFLNCDLREVDFVEADLTAANFEKCDLKDAIFEFTNLTEADLSTSKNIRLDPEKNTIKGARFQLTSLPGLLSKYQINVTV